MNTRFGPILLSLKSALIVTDFVAMQVVLDIDEGHEPTKHTEEEEPPSLRLEPLQKYVGFDA